MLGRRLRIAELREVAAAGSLAGESGAAVRQSLTAKARALRQSALAEAETRARKQSQALFGPLVLMGLGFVDLSHLPDAHQPQLRGLRQPTIHHRPTDTRTRSTQ